MQIHVFNIARGSGPAGQAEVYGVIDTPTSDFVTKNESPVRSSLASETKSNYSFYLRIRFASIGRYSGFH